MSLNLGKKEAHFVYQGDDLIYPIYAAKENLVLHYDFSGMKNSDVTKAIAEDLSGNGNDGVLNNFEYDSESGYEDNGLEFDGVDDYVQGNEEMCFDSTNFTMEFVVKKYDYQEVYSGFGRFGQSFALIGYMNENSIRVAYRGDTGTNAPYVRFFQRDFDYSRIAKVTILFDNSNLTIGAYLNEHYLGEMPMAAKMKGEKELHQTYLGDGKGDFYSFRKYNRLLTPEEIAHNYKIDKKRFNITD